MGHAVERILFTSFMGLVVLGALFIAKDWPIRASIVILLLGSIGVVLVLVQLAIEFIAMRAGPLRRERPTYEVAALEPQGRWGSLEIWAWLWGLFAAIHLIGFPAALPLFVFLYAKVYGARWATACILAAGTWGFLYGIFDQVLHVPWPEPWLKVLLPW
jgi:hypothetical protein